MSEDKEELPGGRPSEEEADTITRDTSAGEALERVGISACIVKEEDDLLQVAEAMAVNLGTHTAAVVDRAGRLVGVIPMRLLLAELYLHVAPEEFLIGMRAFENIAEFGKLSRARNAKGLMEPPVCVNTTDSAREAFIKMHEHKLDSLPVVNNEMRVVACLSRLQLVRLWLQKHQEWAERGEGRPHSRQEGREGGV
ncbi:MAG: CBS domain-containing protein [Dehalococcoidia bacterium]|nr:CBS domain-containing protein [Dehalococcoidia bacterium]